MKTDSRRATRLGTVFRFTVRTLGLLGGLCAAVGACIVATETPEVLGVRDSASFGAIATPVLNGGSGVLAQVGLYLLLVGAAVVLLWAVVELLGGLVLVTGRKTAAGLGNATQVVLAVALLVVVNAVAYRYYLRVDCTRDHRFTLAPEQLEQLQQLDPATPTTIVVLQLGKSSALERATKPDAITTAAQVKVTEKVLDLVEELRQNRDIGSRFIVHVLNSTDENFAEELKAIAPNAPGKVNPLRRAMETATENSIFFSANDRVRRLGFSEFYLLDRTASAGDANAAPNLVLHPQGTERFVNALVGLETRRPKIALAVIHPLLASQEDEQSFTAKGLRSTLETSGFDVTDVILKDWEVPGPEPAPTASQPDESRFAKAEARLNTYSILALTREQELLELLAERDRLAKLPLPAVDRLLRRVWGRAITTEGERTTALKKLYSDELDGLKVELEQFRKNRDKARPEFDKLLADDKLQEAIRNANVKQKFAGLINDCDLLIVPRHTWMDIVRRGAIPSAVHQLNADQASVVREFIAQGKPVLFAIGPPTSDNRRGPTADPAPDDVEKLLAQFGVELGSQTILSDEEVEQIGERRSRADGLQGPSRFAVLNIPKEPLHPIAQAYRDLLRSLSVQTELRKGGARPVYLNATTPGSGVILETGLDTWNEAKPFPDRNSVPAYNPAKPSDPDKGTRNEERRGPFPVGVAIETSVPQGWKEPTAPAGATGGAASASDTPVSLRLAVFGHGGLFVGSTLEPAQEALLLSTVNWQLHREAAMPEPDAATWTFPRVALTAQQKSYWGLMAFPGLPVLAAAIGLFVWMIRRPR